jgi:thiol-disulfide isomerase/thioredoxin
MSRPASLLLALCLFLLAAGLLPNLPATAGGGAVAGKPAPDFVAADVANGKPVSPAQLRGKVVLLNFWAVWSGPCQTILEDLRRWHRVHHDDGLEIVGLTTYYEQYGFDREDKVIKLIGKVVEAGGKRKVIGGLTTDQERQMLREFANHFELPYRIATIPFEDYRQVLKLYGVKEIPTLVLINRKGNVAMVRSGALPETVHEIEETLKELVQAK